MMSHGICQAPKIYSISISILPSFELFSDFSQPFLLGLQVPPKCFHTMPGLVPNVQDSLDWKHWRAVAWWPTRWMADKMQRKKNRHVIDGAVASLGEPTTFKSDSFQQWWHCWKLDELLFVLPGCCPTCCYFVSLSKGKMMEQIVADWRLGRPSKSKKHLKSGRK